MTYIAFGLWLYMTDPSGVMQGPYHLDTMPSEAACKSEALSIDPAFKASYPGWKIRWRCYPGQDT